MASTSSQGGSKSKGKSKGKILNFDELFGTNRPINWAEEVENEAQNVGGQTTTTVEIKTKVTHARMSLPSAPKASRGDVLIDMEKLPMEAPFIAYMRNIAYNANDRSIQEFFNGLDILNIRMTTESGRPKGFCYIEFGSRADLAEALKLNNEPLVGRPVLIDLADRDRDRKKPYDQQQNRERGGRQKYHVSGGAGQVEATGDWQAETRVYVPNAHTMARDHDPPPHQERQHYGTMPSGRPPPAHYESYRYDNDRPEYTVQHGYRPPPHHQGPYGQGQPLPGYYPPLYRDSVHSRPMDQQYYRKRRENDYGRGYNAMGAKAHRDQRDQRCDIGYESERDYEQQSYQYRQEQHDYGGPPRRMGHRGGGPPTTSGGYPVYHQGNYADYGSDNEGYQHSKPVESYGDVDYPIYPPYQQTPQHFKTYPDTVDSSDHCRGGASHPRSYRNLEVPRHRDFPPHRPQRRAHKLSTASTVSVEESICESEITAPKERPKLALQPRTKPVTEIAAPVEKTLSGIFGDAKPVDTRFVEDKAEEKILKLKEETKKRDSIPHSTRDSKIGSLQRPDSMQTRRNSSVNSSRSSPVEDPKPSVTPISLPEVVSFAPVAGTVTILRRPATSNQNNANETFSTGFKTDETLVDVLNGVEKHSEPSKSSFAQPEKHHETVSNKGIHERRGDNRHKRSGRQGGGNYGGRLPIFQDAEVRTKEYERRGSQDSLIFTRGGGGRTKGRRGFAPADGSRGRRRFDTNSYQQLYSQVQQQQQSMPRQPSNKFSPSDSRESNPRLEDGAQKSPVSHSQRKKNRDKPVDKKPSLPMYGNDDPPVYTDVNKFAVLQSMSEDE